MRIKGVNYDAGAFMGMNWRPHFDLPTVRREFEIIRNDLHANAVRIGARDLGRVTVAARAALDQGLEVWFSPLLWDRSPQETLAYLTKGAAAAEPLRAQHPDQVVFCLGGELTLFMNGIVEGKRFTDRVSRPTFFPAVKAGAHNKPLNEFLARANAAVRSVFHGPVTYASLVWEKVHWDLFDYVGVDHYRIAKIEDTYLAMLEPSFSHGKPVVITEFGYPTSPQGLGAEGFLSSSGLGASVIDTKSQVLHYRLPLFGRFIRPHLNGDPVRDEAWQARKLTETLSLLDGAGVEGTFVSQFVSQITPYSENPRYDLDRAGMSLVKSNEGRRHGTTYPDMPWEPKESFRAVAAYYAGQ